MSLFGMEPVQAETPDDELLIPSLTIFGAHSSGGQLATLTLVVAGRVKLLAPPTDKSPDPIPLIAVMVIDDDDEDETDMRWQGGRREVLFSRKTNLPSPSKNLQPPPTQVSLTVAKRVNCKYIDAVW
eukprot:scaffold16499_cov155-Skeletonema_dohrnii-CCMP3373.AAC.2